MRITSNDLRGMVRFIYGVVENMNYARKELIEKDPDFDTENVDHDIHGMIAIGQFLIDLYEEAALSYERTDEETPQVKFSVLSNSGPPQFDGWLKTFLDRAGAPPKPPKEKK